MDSSEEKALNNIEKYGCHILHVMEGDDHPNFSYSIGIEKTSQQPEIIVTGIDRDAAHGIINEYNSLVRSGREFSKDTLYDDFLEGYESQFKLVSKAYFKEYFGWASWLYKGDDYRVFQFVFPSKSGMWPWEENAPTEYTWFLPKLYEN